MTEDCLYLQKNLLKTKLLTPKRPRDVWGKSQTNMDKDNKSFGFLTTDRLESAKKPAYTLREIAAQEYPEFWNAANECVRIAKEFQNMSLEMLPLYAKHLPASFEELQNNEPSQGILLSYLKIRSIYGLAYRIWQIVDGQCRKLAKAGNENDQGSVENAKKELCDVMSMFENLSNSMDIVNDEENGFSRLEQLINDYRPRLDFPVLSNWSYRDITGTIESQGLQYEGLWQAVKDDNVPSEPNITGLMEKDEDNEMVRVY